LRLVIPAVLFFSFGGQLLIASFMFALFGLRRERL
jgi:hypothetical protein